MPSRAAFVVAASMVGSVAAAQGTWFGPPPAITTSLPKNAVVHVRQQVEFTVTATFPRPAPIDLALLDPPCGCIFTVDGRAAGLPPTNVATGRVRWIVAASAGGLRRLTFRAVDRSHALPPVVASIELRVEGGSVGAPILFGDVTGDGVIDTVAGATRADVKIGAAIRADLGAIYVWNGTTSPSGAPDATLFVSSGFAGDALGSAAGQAVQLADLTGDGVLDVVAATWLANASSSVVDDGAAYVWAGGPTLVGTPAPLATLRGTGAVAHDELGHSDGQALQLVDLTGDGQLDVVVSTKFADVGGVADAGAIYVWEGGASLAGTPAPHATLTVPGAVAGDQLGSTSYSGIAGLAQGVRFADVTGDGQVDVVASSARADVAGAVDAGAIYVWEGGAALSGSPPPRATLSIPGAAPYDNLSYGSGEGLQFGDVTGDSVIDLVASALFADAGGVADSGAIYVWRGGSSLSGSPLPRATLAPAGVYASQWFGFASGQGVQLADVSGDGLLDVVAGDAFSSIGGVNARGAIEVWLGGPTLVGAPAAFSTLVDPAAVLGDTLGFSLNIFTGTLIQIGDVTGDGVLDVIAGAPEADVAGVADCGAIHVWRGGAALGGAPAPLASLTVPGAAAFEYLGAMYLENGIQLADVTDDGRLDVVAGAVYAAIGGVTQTGAIHVWKGGSTLKGALAPTATLSVPGAAAYDHLGWGTGQTILIGDVSGDLVPDVVASAIIADVAGVVDAGAVYVWKGERALAGAVAPWATLANGAATAQDNLGGVVGQGIQLVDLTGDSILDLLVGGELEDVGSAWDAGAIRLWKGGATLAGSPAPLATMTVAGAKGGDRLGEAGGQAIHVADVTGDGIVDLIGGACFADGAKVDVGFLYLWSGGATLIGAPPITATLGVPGARMNDRLGM